MQVETLGMRRRMPISSAVAIPLVPTALYDLFVLNIALQLFDGWATYVGLHMGWREANPLIHSLFEDFGVANSLLLFKGLSCGLLLLLYRNAGERLGARAMTLVAGMYALCSLLPWGAILFAAAFPPA